MKVKELIQQLKKMPQDLEVGVTAHDNYEWEIGGWPTCVDHFVKADWTPPDYDDDMWDDAPEECVSIHC